MAAAVTVAIIGAFCQNSYCLEHTHFLTYRNPNSHDGGWIRADM
jgi:hypothetical protein